MQVVMENSYRDTGHRSLALGQSGRWGAGSWRGSLHFSLHELLQGHFLHSPGAQPQEDPASAWTAQGQDLDLQLCKHGFLEES